MCLAVVAVAAMSVVGGGTMATVRPILSAYQNFSLFSAFAKNAQNIMFL
jgi:hypothetical protein